MSSLKIRQTVINEIECVLPKQAAKLHAFFKQVTMI